MRRAQSAARDALHACARYILHKHRCFPWKAGSWPRLPVRFRAALAGDDDEVRVCASVGPEDQVIALWAAVRWCPGRQVAGVSQAGRVCAGPDGLAGAEGD